jgi:hypothetical protein
MNKYIASFKVLKTGHWHSEYFYLFKEIDAYKAIQNKYGAVIILGIELSI